MVCLATFADSLIISDGEQKKIFTIDINTVSLKTLIKSGISRIGGLDFGMYLSTDYGLLKNLNFS